MYVMDSSVLPITYSSTARFVGIESVVKGLRFVP